MITIEELRRAMANETADLRIDLPATRVRRRAQGIRRRRALTVAATVLAVLAAGGIYKAAAPLAVMPAIPSSTTLYYSDGTTVLAALGDSATTGSSGPAATLSLPVGQVVNHVLDELTHTQGSPLFGRSWDSVRDGGYAVTTTIDPRAQRVLERTADAYVAGSAMDGQPEQLQAAGVVIEPGTGRVLAYFGGHDGGGADFASFYRDGDGQATGFGRFPPGSSSMVYTLAAALNAGISLDSRWQWTPHDQPGRAGRSRIRNSAVCASNPGGQSCSLLESTIESLNVPLYGVTVSVGSANVLAMARNAGIDTMWTDDRTRVDLRGADVQQLVPGRFDDTLGLGQYPVTVLDQANAMATFAASGLRATAHFVRRVTSGDETVYTEALPSPSQPRILRAETIADLNYALTRPAGGDLAVKTGDWAFNGRADQNAHAWSIGYTSAVAAAIWVGNKREERALVDNNGATIWGSGLPNTMLRRVVTDTQAALGLTPTPFPPPALGGDEHPTGSTSG